MHLPVQRCDFEWKRAHDAVKKIECTGDVGTRQAHIF